MVWGIEKEPWTWYFRETNTRFPHSYQVNRPEFDQILLQYARDVGVRVYEQTRIDEVLFECERAVGVRIRDRSIEGSFVIDATGQSCLISSTLNMRMWDEMFTNLAIYAYFSNGRHLEGENRGNILIESVPSGWLWKIPLKNDMSSVGLVADRDSMVPTMRQRGIPAVYSSAIEESSIVNDLLSDAQRSSNPVVTRDWSYQSRKFAGPGWVCVGDAACFIDPLFSTGVHLAVSGAFIAAALVETALNSPDLVCEASESYDQLYRQQYEHFRELTALFYAGNRTIDSYFWESRRIANQKGYSPREAFIRTVSGQDVAGYERSVLQRADTPVEFRKLLEQLDSDRTQRHKNLCQADVMDATVVVKPGIEIKSAAILDGSQFTRGNVIRSKERVDVPVSDFVADIVQYCNDPISVSSLVQRFPDSSSQSHLIDLIHSAVSVLVTDGILELKETTSRSR